MKNIVSFLLLVIVFGACTEEFIPPAPVLPTCCGNVQAKFNGQDWTAIPYGEKINFSEEAKYWFVFGLYVDNILYQQLYIKNLPASEGSFRPFAPNYGLVFDTNFSSRLLYVDEDLVFGRYILLSSDTTNVVQVDSFDSANKIFRGRFNLTLIADGKPYSYSPDTIRLTNGAFMVDCK